MSLLNRRKIECDRLTVTASLVNSLQNNEGELLNGKPHNGELSENDSLEFEMLWEE